MICSTQSPISLQSPSTTSDPTHTRDNINATDSSWGQQRMTLQALLLCSATFLGILQVARCRLVVAALRHDRDLCWTSVARELFGVREGRRSLGWSLELTLVTKATVPAMSSLWIIVSSDLLKRRAAMSVFTNPGQIVHTLMFLSRTAKNRDFMYPCRPHLLAQSGERG